MGEIGAESLREIVPDSVTWHPGGSFTGFAYVLETEGQLTRDIDINIKPEKPLDPFHYNNPVVNPDSSLREFVLDEEPKTGYFPVAYAENSRRAPNHLYKAEDAIIAVVKTGEGETQTYETEYFQKSNLSPETWIQALNILGKEV